MGQIVRRGEKVVKKKVYFTGTDTLPNGAHLCYNADAIRSAETNAAITAANDTAKTAADEYRERAYQVEKPSLTNLNNYAGALVDEYAGRTGPVEVEIFLPISCGQKVNIATEEDCTIDSTILTVKAGSYYAGGVNEGIPIAKAMQTVNRSETNGIVQALLVGITMDEIIGDVISAKSRTAVQLPTNAIWRNFNLDMLRKNPFAGTLAEADFQRDQEYPYNTFKDTESTITPTGVAIGELQLFVTADNEAAEIQLPGSINITTGGRWAYEARIKSSSVTTEENALFIGLMVPVTLVGDLFADGGAAPQAGGTVGHMKYAADTTELKATYEKTGQAINQHDDDITIAEGVYQTVGMYFDGTDIQIFINGVNSGDPILGVGDMDQADFPANTEMLPTITIKGGAATNETFIVDWYRFAQEA